MPSPGSLAILTLKDKNGISYEMKVDLKYDVITRNNNYIEDLFGFEDIHKKYPGITEKRWQIISRGDLEVGMSTDECRLSIGDPIEIVLKRITVLRTGSIMAKHWNSRVAPCNVSNKKEYRRMII